MKKIRGILLLTMILTVFSIDKSKAQVNSTFTITASCSQSTPPSPLYSTFTITVSFNYPPVPVWISPAGSPTSNTGFTLNPRPKVWFYANDKNGDQLGDWMFIIADDANFTTNVSTYQFSVSQSGWLPSSSPVPQGTTFYYTPQVNFTKTYHWIKVMVKDYGVTGGDGSNRTVWGASEIRKIYINPFVWTDPTITAGQTLIRSIHFTELRNVINNLRQFRNLSTCSWTDTLTAGSTMIRKIHLDEMRQCLDGALFVVGESTGPATWTDGTITPGSTIIRAVHINELRTKCAKP